MNTQNGIKEPLPKNPKEIAKFLKDMVGSFFSRLFYIYKLVWEARPWILFTMLFMAIFNGITPIIGAYIGKELLNSIVKIATDVGKYDFSIVMNMMVLQFGYIFIVRLVSSIDSMINRISGELVVNNIKVKIINKAKNVDLSSFDLPKFYEKFENANREAGRRPIEILNSTFKIMSTLISMLSFIFILWAVSPSAPLIIVIMSIPSAIINFIYRKKNVLYMRRRSKDRRQMDYYSNLMVNKDMVKEIRLFGLSGTFIKRFQSVFNKYFNGIKKLIVSEGIWNIALTIITTVVNCVLYLYIALKVFNGELTVGDYSLYTGALNTIAGGVATIIVTTANIYEGTLFIDNMIDFMNEEKTIVPLISPPLNLNRHIGHTIQLENVCFKYPGTERDILHNINLTINQGDTTVIVGLNGAGKTTLIKLITRLYDPTSGRILLDGNDIRNYDVDKLYDMFGIIFQDYGKYAVTVSENISFGNIQKSIDENEIHTSAKKSNADGFISKLPLGYDTPLMRYFEEEGIELSIGQWQKLAIARAFYSDSDILILDEPTAALDPMAEQEIFNQFNSLRENKTTIFVSHRLSSATSASKIIVLENGNLIEEGNHMQLMNKKGVYYTLFSTQAKPYVAIDTYIK